MSDDRVVAAGGLCVPRGHGFYDLAPRLGPASVLSDLPVVRADRGRIAFPAPPDPWLTPDPFAMPYIDPTPRLSAVLARGRARLARGRAAGAEVAERLGFAWRVARHGVPERYADPDTWFWPDDFDEGDE